MTAMDRAQRPDGTEPRPGRRAVIRGISAMGLAAFAAPHVLESSAAATETAPQPTPAPPKKSASNKPAPKAKDNLVKASNTPLAATSDIPVNHGMLFEADGYIVTQPKPGKFVGFDSLCTHEGCPVDVFDTPGEMDCSCHSSHFKITDGKVISGPAKKPMPKKPIIVENGQIYKAKAAKKG